MVFDFDNIEIDKIRKQLAAAKEVAARCLLWMPVGSHRTGW
jgi:hypothetical protein